MTQQEKYNTTVKEIEVDLSNLNSPEEVARNFFLDRDISLLNERIDSLKQFLLMLVHNNDRLQKQVNELYDEKWADKTLQEMKNELLNAKSALNRGFPITKEEDDKINQWMAKHDREVHNNPEQYHGCSGGGYEFRFYPTSLGVISQCICVSCKTKAIAEKGTKWYDYCNKELHGIFEFGDWG